MLYVQYLMMSPAHPYNYFAALLYSLTRLSEQSPEERNKNCYCNYKAYNASVTAEHASELEYYKAYDICESALPADCSPRPLAAVHLALYSTDCSETRRAEQVEDKEGKT